MSNSCKLQLCDEFGEMDLGVLSATQLTIHVEADGSVLLGASDVVPFTNPEAGPRRYVAQGGAVLQFAVPVVVASRVDDSEILVCAVAQLQSPGEAVGVVPYALEHIHADGVVRGSCKRVLHCLDR